MITRVHWRSRGSKVRRLLGAGPLRSLIGWAAGSGGKQSRAMPSCWGWRGVCVPIWGDNNALRAGELSLQSPSQLQLELSFLHST